ncbi:MAG TPA: hypothetical protein VFS18_01175, partial [Actinomycetota bacterium]|nr:hypothetical protein [Actinomycetota bacterium]
DRASYLSSPVAYYPMTDDVRVVPYGFDVAAVDYMEAELNRATRDGEPFLLVTREPDVPWAAWFIGAVRDEGWAGALEGRFGVIEVWSFTPA